MNCGQAINYFKSSGFSDEQIIEVADALTKGAISQLRAEIMKLQTYKMYEGENTVYVERDDVLQIFDKYAESEE